MGSQSPNTRSSMTTLRAGTLLLATAVVALSPRRAICQGNTDSRLTIGVATGPALTSGETGLHASVAIEVRTPVRPLRLRAEGLYARWGGVGVARFSSITANAIASPFPRTRISPYAIVGAGGYANFGDGMRAGWSVGAGLQFPNASRWLLESRLHAFSWDGRHFPLGHPAHTLSDKSKFVWFPISLGIRF